MGIDRQFGPMIWIALNQALNLDIKGRWNLAFYASFIRSIYIMKFIARRALLFSAIPAMAFLQSCGMISETGPLEGSIKRGSGEYELISVTSKKDIPKPIRMYGKAHMPPMVKGSGYTDRIKERDYLLFVIADLSEQSPFFTGGEPYKYGPIEVPSSGDVTIPYLGKVAVDGKDLNQLTSELSEKMKPVSKTAQISVAITERFLAHANVYGDVRAPGPKPLDRSGLTSLDILAAAGGPAESEHLFKYVLRRANRNYEFDFKGFKENPFAVEAGDLITVSKDHSNRFYVMGAINNPVAVAFPVPKPTLADAIGAAYGFDERRSDPSGVFVFRKSEPNQVFTFDLKQPNVFQLAQRFPIEGEDVVYVTEAPLSRWNRMISQILPITVTNASNAAARYSN